MSQFNLPKWNTFQDFQPVPGLDPWNEHQSWYQDFINNRPVVQRRLFAPLDPDKSFKDEYCRKEPNVDYYPVEYQSHSIRRNLERIVLVNSCQTVPEVGFTHPIYGPGGAPCPQTTRLHDRQSSIRNPQEFPSPHPLKTPHQYKNDFLYGLNSRQNN